MGPHKAWLRLYLLQAALCTAVAVHETPAYLLCPWEDAAVIDTAVFSLPSSDDILMHSCLYCTASQQILHVPLVAVHAV